MEGSGRHDEQFMMFQTLYINRVQNYFQTGVLGGAVHGASQFMSQHLY